MSISPQGYSLGDNPKSSNPFWGENEDSSVKSIFASASVQGTTADGQPSVETDKTVDGHNITFGFLFKNIIGKNGVSPAVAVTDIAGGHRVSITDATSTHTFDIMDGVQGQKGDAGVSPDVSVREIVGGHIITITDATGSESFTVMNGTQGEKGEKGEKGDNGDTPVITITATQNGTPITVTKTGTDAAPNFNFALAGGGGGGSTSGTVGWGTYGAEVAGKYPRSKKEEYKLSNPITVNESGTNSFYINDMHEYSWTLTGELPTDFEVNTAYKTEMTPGGHAGFDSAIVGDVTPYLTATITPKDEMTVDNIRVKLVGSYVNDSDNSLNFFVDIFFTPHYKGEDSPETTINTTIKANAGEFTSSASYAYLEIFPEA